MSDTIKKKCWFLKVELAVLVCVICIWIVKALTVDIDSTKAAVLKQVVKISPNSANAHFNLGCAYYNTDNLEAAIKSFDMAIRTDPEYWEAYEWLASCYWETGQPTESIKTWNQALKRDPNYAWAHVALAFDYKDLSRYEEVIAELKHLCEVEPDIAGLHVMLGDAYTKAGRPEEGVLACKHALSLNPNIIQAHFYLAKAYLKMGNKALALEEYEALYFLDEKWMKRLRVDVKYALAVAIILNEEESDHRKLSQKLQVAKTELNTQHALRKMQLQAIQTMVAEGTISAAEGKLKQCDVVLQAGKAMDQIVRRSEFDLQPLGAEQKARPDTWELAELEMEKIDEHIRQGLRLSSFQLPEMEKDRRLQTDTEADPLKN